MEEDTGKAKSNGAWYPGKYLGMSRSEKSSSTDGTLVIRSENETSEIEDSGGVLENTAVEGKRRSIFGWRQDSSDDAESDEKESSKEAIFVRTVRGIRRKILARGLLQGHVTIKRISGIVSTTVVYEFTPADVDEEAKYADDSTTGTSSSIWDAVSLTDTILNSLERRSKIWEEVDFNSAVTLTRGGTIGISDPLFGMINWSITVEITCTVQSIVRSRKVREAQKEFELANKSSVTVEI